MRPLPLAPLRLPRLPRLHLHLSLCQTTTDQMIGYTRRHRHPNFPALIGSLAIGTYIQTPTVVAPVPIGGWKAVCANLVGIFRPLQNLNGMQEEIGFADYT